MLGTKTPPQNQEPSQIDRPPDLSPRNNPYRPKNAPLGNPSSITSRRRTGEPRSAHNQNWSSEDLNPTTHWD
eukprot:4752562-Pyramimonas_sp.AAC.1